MADKDRDRIGGPPSSDSGADALRASEQRLRLALEGAEQGLFDLNLQTGKAVVSPEYARMAGYEPGELEATTDWWRTHLHPDDRPQAEGALAACMRGERTEYRIEYRFRTKSGEWRTFLSLGRVVEHDPRGVPLRLLGTHTDLTERVRAEQAAERARLLLEAVLDQSPVPMVVVSAADLVVTHANRASRELLGIADEPSYEGLPLPESLRHRSWRDFRPDGSPIEPSDLPLSRALRGETVSGEEMRVLRKDGTSRWEKASARPVYGPNGELVAGLVAFQDVTEQKEAQEQRSRLEAQLQHAMKMEAVGRLAGGVAHDFNNLLTTILGNVDIARADLRGSDTVAEAIDAIGQAARSAAALTAQLLAFSRRQMIEPKVLDPNNLIDGLKEMLSRLLGEDITLKTSLREDIGAVRADPGQLEQVLVNLAVNARDAMQGGGVLSIATSPADLDEDYCVLHPYVRPGPYVLLAVSDTGQGMSEETKRHLFEPFFTTKPVGQGTGLGLATTFGVVKQAGGTIEVYSEVGRGTSFKIYLPRIDAIARELRAPAPEHAPPTGQETVLLVEDEEAVRALALKVLQRLGYNALVATDGVEAERVAKEFVGRIDLLMTDVVMPGTGGRELSQRLLGFHPEMSVLFTSGYTDDVVVRHGVEQENLNFLAKPYSLRSLADKIRDVLGPAGRDATGGAQ